MLNDAGAETASNYRFQHVYAALLAVQMYNQKNDFTEITCEIGNDIIAKDNEGDLIVYQLTRTDGHSITPHKIKESMRHFLEQNKSPKHKAFCLIANQRIGTIALKNNEMVYLTPAQISKYASELSVDVGDDQSRKCFEKMAFMIVNDTLGLQYLIIREIVSSMPKIPHDNLKCIEAELINLAQKCCRTAEKEESSFYTNVDNKQRQQSKIESRTITYNDVRNVITNCQGKIDTAEHNTVFRSESLKENDERLITQFITEASDEDEKIASTALISLEHLGSEMKIYKSGLLMKFLRYSLNDDSKSSFYDYYLDLIKRLLYQSTKEEDNNFLKYVKKYLKKKITDCATSLDIKYDRCRTNAMQIIDYYSIMTPPERTELYIQTLMEFVKYCKQEERYSDHLQYITHRIPNNTENRSTIRNKLIASKKEGSSTEETKQRCDDLLDYYK